MNGEGDTPQEGLLRPQRGKSVGQHGSGRARDSVGSRGGSIRYVEYCPSCGDFNWGCLGCGIPAGIQEIARAGKGAEKLFRQLRILETWELNALIFACISSGGASGARDAAMITLLCQARLQAAELVALELQDWDQTRRKPIVKGRVVSQPRVVTIDLAISGAIERWLSVRGSQPGSLFVNLHSRDEMVRCAGIASGAVYEVLRKRSSQAGIEHVTVTDLHSASLRPQANASLQGPSSTQDTSGIILPAVGKGSARKNQLHAELSAAAKAMACLHPIDKDGPGPLGSLSTKELTRLNKRAEALLLSRELDKIEGVANRTARQPYPKSRQKIAEAVLGGIPAQEIRRFVGVSTKTIDRCLAENRDHSGKPSEGVYNGVPKIGAREKEILLKDLQARPSISSDERAKYILQITGVQVTGKTIRGYIIKMGYRYSNRQWVQSRDGAEGAK